MHADPAARRMMDRVFFVAGALLAGLAVAFGAFGAHALRAVLSPASLATFDTAVRYQMKEICAVKTLPKLKKLHFDFVFDGPFP